MTTQKRSPWFNARREPPVNGGPGDKYELMCAGPYGWLTPKLWTVQEIKECACPHCKWRGLLREGGK